MSAGKATNLPVGIDRNEAGQLIEKNGQPLAIYRGVFQHPDKLEQALQSPFDSLYYRATPTFSRCPDIAAVYASNPNDRSLLEAEQQGVVGVYSLRMSNPLVLGNDDGVVGLSDLKDLMGEDLFYDHYFQPWFQELIKEHFLLDGDVPDYGEWDLVLEGELDRALEGAYTEVFRLFDNEPFVELMKTMGYDGGIYHGLFLSDHLFKRDISQLSEANLYDSVNQTALEFRPFEREQITPYYPIKADFDRKFLQEHEGGGKKHKRREVEMTL